MKKTLFLIAAILVIATMAFGQLVTRPSGYTGTPRTGGIASGSFNLLVLSTNAGATWRVEGPFDISDCIHKIPNIGTALTGTDSIYALDLNMYMFNDLVIGGTSSVACTALLSPFVLKHVRNTSGTDSVYGPMGPLTSSGLSSAAVPGVVTPPYYNGITTGVDSATIFDANTVERGTVFDGFRFTNVNPASRYLYLKFTNGASNAIANKVYWGVECSK